MYKLILIIILVLPLLGECQDCDQTDKFIEFKVAQPFGASLAGGIQGYYWGGAAGVKFVSKLIQSKGKPNEYQLEPIPYASAQYEYLILNDFRFFAITDIGWGSVSMGLKFAYIVNDELAVEVVPEYILEVGPQANIGLILRL